MAETKIASKQRLNKKAKIMIIVLSVIAAIAIIAALFRKRTATKMLFMSAEWSFPILLIIKMMMHAK